jgi:hypothetical protein
VLYVRCVRCVRYMSCVRYVRCMHLLCYVRCMHYVRFIHWISHLNCACRCLLCLVLLTLWATLFALSTIFTYWCFKYFMRATSLCSMNCVQRWSLLSALLVNTTWIACATGLCHMKSARCLSMLSAPLISAFCIVRTICLRWFHY